MPSEAKSLDADPSSKTISPPVTSPLPSLTTPKPALDEQQPSPPKVEPTQKPKSTKKFPEDKTKPYKTIALLPSLPSTASSTTTVTTPSSSSDEKKSGEVSDTSLSKISKPAIKSCPSHFSLHDAAGTLDSEKQAAIQTLFLLSLDLRKENIVLELHGSIVMQFFIFLILGISITSQDIDAAATLSDDVKHQTLDTILQTHGFKQKLTTVLSTSYLAYIHSEHRIDVTFKGQYYYSENSFPLTSNRLQFTKESTPRNIQLQLASDQVPQLNTFIKQRLFPVRLPSPYNQNIRMFWPRFIKYRERIGEVFILVYQKENWLASSISAHDSSIADTKSKSYSELSVDELMQYAQNFFHCKFCLHLSSFDNHSLAVKDGYSNIRKIWYDGTLATLSALMVIQAFFMA